MINENERIEKKVKCPYCPPNDCIHTFVFSVEKSHVHAASAIGLYLMAIISLNATIFLLYSIFAGYRFLFLVIGFAVIAYMVDASFLWFVKNTFTRNERERLIEKEFTFVLHCPKCKKDFQIKLPLLIKKGDNNFFSANQIEA